MRIRSLKIDKFKSFKNFDINFNHDVTAIIGKNGVGKTTILETIYNVLTYSIQEETLKIGRSDSFIASIPKEEYPFISQDIGFKGVCLSFESKNAIKGAILKLEVNKNGLISKSGDWNILNNEIISSNYLVNEEKKSPQVLYFPTEINFSKFKPKNIEKFEYDNKFGDIYDSKNISENLKKFLIFQNYQDLEDFNEGKKGYRINRFKEVFNSFYEDKEFIGIKGMEPLIKIKDTNEKHSIDELSSGEKQIFFRVGSIISLDLENSVILIDEPETSMHPEWQQKILNLYRSVTKKNQLIIATHSPHIISSCKSDEIRILEKIDNNNIIVKSNFDETFGRTIEQLLFSVFDLKSVRDCNAQDKLNRFKELYTKGESNNLSDKESIEFKELKDSIYNYVDPNDPELFLVSIKDTTEKLKNALKDLKGESKKNA
jgi:predicted ATP-binding protein involved in virulence